MAIIDADAHVIETDHTWDYMRSEDEAFRPLIVETINKEGPRRAFWIIGDRAGGRSFSKNTNSGTGTSDESRELTDVRRGSLTWTSWAWTSRCSTRRCSSDR